MQVREVTHISCLFLSDFEGMCAGNRAALSVEYSFSKGKELEIITAITRDPLTKKVHRIPVVKYERDITA